MLPVQAHLLPLFAFLASDGFRAVRPDRGAKVDVARLVEAKSRHVAVQADVFGPVNWLLAGGATDYQIRHRRFPSGT